MGGEVDVDTLGDFERAVREFGRSECLGCGVVLLQIVACLWVVANVQLRRRLWAEQDKQIPCGDDNQKATATARQGSRQTQRQRKREDNGNGKGVWGCL